MTDDRPAPAENALAVLLSARRLLAHTAFCQHAEAKDAVGRPVHPLSPDAQAFSASGAVYRASAFDGSPERRQLLERACAWLAEAVGAPLLRWNDQTGRTQDQVLAAFDAAAAAHGS
jgi:hypothetical protein